MSSRKEDAAPDLGASEDQVVDYLGREPDFLLRHPELLDRLTPPQRWSGDGVVDIQRFMLSRMRGEVDDLRRDFDALKGSTLSIIETTRSNLSSQARTHEAVVAFLAAESLDELLAVVAEDLPLLLDVDVVAVGFERWATPVAPLLPAQLRLLPNGTVDSLLGSGREVVLTSVMADDGIVFGAAADLVRSAALVRLGTDTVLPAGLMALGAREAAFHAGQGSELVVFLARVLERCIGRWLTTSGPAAAR